MKNLIVVLFILALQSCLLFPTYEEFVCLGVDNKSRDSILVYLAADKPPIYPTVYPDTCLPRNSYVGEINGVYHTNDSISGYLTPIPPHEQSSVLCTIINYNYFGGGRHKKIYNEFFSDFVRVEYLSFFFLSADSVRKYGYDHVASHNMILSRYDLTASDMKSLEMMIPYPPTEEMKGMKIWNYNH